MIMRLFLDTEFTDLVPGAKLISIALVDEDENYFYAELTDTYEPKDCSNFVKSFVLPFLKGVPKMTHQECALAIGNWIEDRNVPCIIASDAPNWDIPHLNKLIQDCIPVNLETKMIYSVRIPADLETALALKHGYNIHNALDDAFIMKKGTLGY
jgi:hypothetical protein